MGKKYLETKKGSLESSILGVWQDAIEEGDARVSAARMDGRTTEYKSHRAKLETARTRREDKRKASVAEELDSFTDEELDRLTDEEVDLYELDDEMFEAVMKKKSASDRKASAKKRAKWAKTAGGKKAAKKAKKRAAKVRKGTIKVDKSKSKAAKKRAKLYSGDINEEELDEKSAKYLEIEFKDSTTAANAYSYINNKIEPGGRQPWDDFNQEGSSIQFENMKDADFLMKELGKKFKFKVYEREEVDPLMAAVEESLRKIKSRKHGGGNTPADQGRAAAVDEGTWSLPKTPKQKAELKKLLSKPLPAKGAADKLYDLIGDDELFDDIAGFEKEMGSKSDVRDLVRDRMKELGIKEEVDLDEGKMKELHMYIQQGKSAEWIAKTMGVDVKTIKALMSESLNEASGDKEAYQKFFNKTLKKFKIDSPADLKSDEEKKKFYDYIDKNWEGDHEESFDYVKEFKVQSMRDALAKVWGVEESKTSVKKENDDEKEVTKDGKTLTGKKAAKIDINPEIKDQ